MEVWTCNDFTGHWPVGTAAVVIAETAEEAAALLSAKTSAEISEQVIEPSQMKLVDTTKPQAIILNDGDY